MKRLTHLLTLLLALGTGQAAYAQLGVMTSTDDVNYEYYIQSFAAGKYYVMVPSSGTNFYFCNGTKNAKFIFKENSSNSGAYSLYVTNASSSDTLPVIFIEETVNSYTSYNLGYSEDKSTTPAAIYINSTYCHPTNVGQLPNCWGINFYATRPSDSKNAILIRKNSDGSTQRLAIATEEYPLTSSTGPWYVFRLVPASPAPMIFPAGSAYATYSTGVDAAIPTGVKAYAATLSGTTLTLKEITDSIPAYTGVILVRTGNDVSSKEVITPTEAQTTGTMPSSNDLIATSTGDAFEKDETGTTAPTTSGTAKITATLSTDDGTAYGLGLGYATSDATSQTVGFYQIAADEDGGTTAVLPAYKAYLRVPSTVSAIKIAFPDGTTSIVKVINADNENAPVYDLSGRRVVKTAKGSLYIKNGKKFLAQ